MSERLERTSQNEKSNKAKTKRKLVYEKFKHHQKPHPSRSATRVSGFHYRPCASLFRLVHGLVHLASTTCRETTLSSPTAGPSAMASLTSTRSARSVSSRSRPRPAPFTRI